MWFGWRFFLSIFFLFSPARLLARFFLWLLLLRWFCFYFVTVYIYQCRIYVYTRCLQIKVLVLVGSIFAPVDMANIQSKTATTCFWKAPTSCRKVWGQLGRITYSIPAFPALLSWWFCDCTVWRDIFSRVDIVFFWTWDGSWQQNNPPSQTTSSVF